MSKSKKNPLLKNFLHFRENRRSSPKLKKLFIFQKETYKAPKANKKSAPKKHLVSCEVSVIFTAVKHREIPFDYLNVM